MNIFEALRISHATQRELADQLIQTQGDSPERTSLFNELKREGSEFTIPNDGHLNAVGHAVIADEIEKVLGTIHQRDK